MRRWGRAGSRGDDQIQIQSQSRAPPIGTRSRSILRFKFRVTPEPAPNRKGLTARKACRNSDFGSPSLRFRCRGQHSGLEKRLEELGPCLAQQTAVAFFSARQPKIRTASPQLPNVRDFWEGVGLGKWKLVSNVPKECFWTCGWLYSISTIAYCDCSLHEPSTNWPWRLRSLLRTWLNLACLEKRWMFRDTQPTRET